MRLFILLLTTLALSFAAHAEKRIALLVGNSEYTGSAKPLANPVNDVDLMAKALRDVGFEVHTVKDANRNQMMTAFKEHGNRLKDAGKDAVGFFYYAGHGIQSRGYNYLAPVELNAYVEQDVWGQSPRLGDLLAFLDFASNKTNFIVLDACRDNPLPAASRTSGGGLAQLKRSRGMLIAYATQPGAVAADGAGLKNSPFTDELARLITRPGLSAESLFRNVASNVEYRTSERQQPWYESGLRGSKDFCFAGCGAKMDDEASALSIALASGEVARLEEFRSLYPNSKNRSLVEQQIAALEAKAREEAGPVMFMGAAPTVPAERKPMSGSVPAESQPIPKDAPAWDTISARDWSEKPTYNILEELDESTTFSEVKDAADTGNVKAATLLGMIYYYGRLGEGYDYALAIKYLDTACQAGSARACFNLGTQYAYGHGLDKSSEKAEALFRQACDGGNKYGCNKLSN